MGIAVLLHDCKVLLFLLFMLSQVSLYLSVLVLVLKMLGLVVYVNCCSALLFKCYAFDAHLHTPLILYFGPAGFHLLLQNFVNAILLHIHVRLRFNNLAERSKFGIIVFGIGCVLQEFEQLSIVV